MISIQSQLTAKFAQQVTFALVPETFTQLLAQEESTLLLEKTLHVVNAR